MFETTSWCFIASFPPPESRAFRYIHQIRSGCFEGGLDQNIHTKMGSAIMLIIGFLWEKHIVFRVEVCKPKKKTDHSNASNFQLSQLSSGL